MDRLTDIRIYTTKYIDTHSDRSKKGQGVIRRKIIGEVGLGTQTDWEPGYIQFRTGTDRHSHR